MKRLLARLLGMTLLLATVSASPASAAGELGLSVDGVAWTSSIAGPLFDQPVRWVPGDSETATFYVRNQGGSIGNLTVDVLGSQLGDLIDSGDLHVTARGGGGAWTTVSEGGTHCLLTAPNIPNGSIVPIDVTIAFDFSSPNPTQIRSSDVNFRVNLSGDTPTGGGNGTGTGTDNTKRNGLPGTGAPEELWIAAIGAMLIGAGLAFVSRRREEGTDV